MTLASLVGRRAGLGLVWGSLALSAVGLLAAPARAHTSFLEVTRDAGVTVLSCTEALECTGPGSGFDECDGLTCAAVNGGLSVCIEPPRQLPFEIFCCDTDDDCPVRDNASPRNCSPVLGDIRVCTWSSTVPRAYNFCTPNTTPTFQSVLGCFNTSVSGRLSLAAGDCDGDGISNDTDGEVCSRPIEPPVDGGVIPIGDLGVDEDLGTDDGGSTTVDQGPAVDLGGGVNPGVGFQGGGGCSAGALRGTPGAALLMVFGALLLARRRRSR
ncbi:MAG: hypothetical protein IPG81_15095 [Sandaracinaceae bacterium]|jgi:uncharacterized protein (TIGR03382 family)|nr:hypothetical protein [Sandaracinaceae bacterium]